LHPIRSICARRLRGMESRVRTGAAAASPRPVERRTRRLSAPSSFFDQRAAAEPKREVASPSQARQWVTTSSTAWRTAPSSMGYRIDLLPRGWQVTQASWAEHPVEGWLPIVPKGFVQLSDLVEAEWSLESVGRWREIPTLATFRLQ
ncbi:unnamed protein product, partial [Effrenium voratum]